MKNERRRRWTMHLRNIITAVFAIAFCASIFSTLKTSAEANVFTIENAELTELSDSAEGDITNFNGLEIISDVTFHNVGDTAKYTITIKNTDNKDHQINSITDNNENPYISYEYDSYANILVRANESFDFIVTAKYENALNNLSERVQVSNVKFLINYLNEQEEEQTEIPLAPDTSGKSAESAGEAIKTNVIALIISAIGLIVCVVLLARNHKTSTKFIALLTFLVSAITFTTSAKALTVDVNTISFKSNVTLADKVAVTFNIDGNEATDSVTYNTVIDREDPQKAGHTFGGWMLEDGSDFDTETKITEDLVLVAKFTPSSIAVNFNGNGLSFANGETSNIIEYTKSCHEEPVSTSAISHTDNVNDDGTVNEDFLPEGFEIPDWVTEDEIEDYLSEIKGRYPSDLSTLEAYKLDGASSLKISLTYAIENSYDSLYIIEGYFPTEPEDDPGLTEDQIHYITGGEWDDENDQEKISTTEITIPGDSVTFNFMSDNSVGYYGYYAIITPLDENGDEILSDETVTVCENSVSSGRYAEPETSDIQVFYGWSEDPNATQPEYKTLQEVINNIGGELGDTKTVYAVWEERETLTIKLHGNGLKFNDNTEETTLKYVQTCQTLPIEVTRYSHTSNIDDEGNTNTTYSSNLATKDIITIPGAKRLKVTVRYTTESGWDYLYVFTGEYTGSVNRNMSAGQDKTYNGGSNGTSTDTFYIEGDTTTFAFYSDGSAQYYGYYAVIEGLDENDDTLDAGTYEDCDREQIAGTYKEPTTNALQEFFGWSESPDAAFPEYFNEQEIKDTIQGETGEIKDLYAFWVKLHTVHFDGNGATSGTMNDQKMYGGYPNILNSNNYYRENYTFLGWSTDKDATVPEYENEDDFTAPDNYETTTLYAIWQKKVRIIYNGNGATSGSMIDDYCDAGAIFDLSSNRFSRTNYDFIGWSTDKDAILPTYENQASFTTPTDKEEVTLYAIWATKHHVIFDGNGATSGEMDDQYYTRGSTINLPANYYAKSKYLFLGWSTDKDAIIPRYTDVSSFTVPTNTNETTLYAIWVKQFVIHFDGNGATSGSMGDRIIAVGGTINLPDNAFAKTNFIFTGWSEDENALVGTYENQASFTAPTDAEETTLYAIWRQKPVVHFNGNGSTSGTMSDQVFEFNTAATLRNNSFYRTNYTFLGWSEDQDVTTPTYENKASFTPPTDRDETTLYAIWKKKFAIHFDINGGEDGTMADQYVEWTSVSTTLNMNQFTKPKYYVDGWSTDKDAVEPTYADGGTFTLPTDGTTEVTLYAIWKPAYTIHFIGGDDVEGEMINYRWDSNEVEGEATTMIKRVNTQGMLVSPNYSKPGYGFAGWSEDPDAASKINNTSNKPKIYGPNENITLTSSFANTATEEGDLTLYAVWLPAETDYTLQTFNKTAFEAAYPNKKVIALRDERDNNVYAIAKIAGGYWWMMENLRLDFSDPNTTITAANTNNPSSTFLSQISSYKGRTDYQNFFNYCDRQVASCYDIVNFSTNNINRAYKSVYTYKGSSVDSVTPVSWYSYGVYYNWYTAVAGTEAAYRTHEIPADGRPITASGDICPAGWKLPSGGTYGDYNDIYVALGGTRAMPFNGSREWYASSYDQRWGESHLWYEYPVNATKSGVITNGSRGYRNQGTQYHTSSMGIGSLGTYFMEYIDTYNGTLQDRNVIGGYREIHGNAGFTVRCIAK